VPAFLHVVLAAIGLLALVIAIRIVVRLLLSRYAAARCRAARRCDIRCPAQHANDDLRRGRNIPDLP